MMIVAVPVVSKMVREGLRLAQFLLHGLAVGDVHEVAEDGGAARVGDRRDRLHHPADLLFAGDDPEFVSRRAPPAEHLARHPLDVACVVGVDEAVGAAPLEFLDGVSRDGGDDRVYADEQTVLRHVHPHEGFLREGPEDVVAASGAGGEVGFRIRWSQGFRAGGCLVVWFHGLIGLPLVNSYPQQAHTRSVHGRSPVFRPEVPADAAL